MVVVRADHQILRFGLFLILALRFKV